MRDALKDHYLGEVFIKKGTMVAVSILGRHYM